MREIIFGHSTGGSSSDAIEVVTERTPSTLTARFRGRADASTVMVFASTLARLHGHAVRQRTAEVVVDVRDLDSMSSGCFQCLAEWIGCIQELEPTSRYVVRVVSKPEIVWQRRTFHALHCFAADLVTLSG